MSRFTPTVVRLCLLGFSLSATYPVAAADLLLPAASTRQGPPQGPPPGEHRRPPADADLLKNLDLTDKQKPRVKAILKKHKQQLEALHGKKADQTDREAMRAQMRQLEEQTDAELKRELTPAQYATLQQNKQRQPQPPQKGTPPASKAEH